MPCCVGNAFASAPHFKPSLQAEQVARKRELEDEMNSIQSRLFPALITMLFSALSVQTSLAQAPTNIVRTVLAVTSLPSVVDAPLYFKLSRVELAPGQMTTYSGPVGFVYALSGTLTVDTNAGQQSLRQDDAVLVAASNAYSLKSSATEPRCSCTSCLADPPTLIKRPSTRPLWAPRSIVRLRLSRTSNRAVTNSH